ncbi:hypothetical protein GALL_377510 [mine drainage metagenome]|uniref:Uncharacterized protein n=1 Tax=mine drainage metagenome TaxID=410659 RepID=A0A1J5QAT4_9ZZZZ
MTPAAIDAEMRQARAQLVTQQHRRRRDSRRRSVIAERLHALWVLRLNLMAQELRRDR